MHIWNMFLERFWKENDLDGSQGDLKALGHPQRPRQAQPWGVQQAPFIFIIKNWHSACLYTISKINQFKMVPCWSLWSRTPSATSTSSTKARTASTIMFIKVWHGTCIYYFSKTNWFKTVPSWYRVIKCSQTPSSSSTMGSSASTT